MSTATFLETTEFKARVAAQIRAEMDRQQRTEADLARHLGRTEVAFSRCLRQGTLTVSELVRVAEWLGVPVVQLVERAEGASA